jgi:hypothetical protein
MDTKSIKRQKNGKKFNRGLLWKIKIKIKKGQRREIERFNLKLEKVIKYCKINRGK